MKAKRPVLIYDGECPVCKRTIEWIRKNSKRNTFEFLPCQSENARGRYPSIKKASCMKAMQLVLPDGKVLSGEKALPEILKRVKRYSFAAEIFRLPGSDVISRAFYRWFADRRYHIANILFPRQSQIRPRRVSKRG